MAKPPPTSLNNTNLNGDSGWSSSAAYTKFPTPKVSWDTTSLSPDSFNIWITTGADALCRLMLKCNMRMRRAPSLFPTVPVTMSGVPFSAQIPLTAPSGNMKYTKVNAQVGPDIPSSPLNAWWSNLTTTNLTVYTQPVPPQNPPIMGLGFHQQRDADVRHSQLGH